MLKRVQLFSGLFEHRIIPPRLKTTEPHLKFVDEFERTDAFAASSEVFRSFPPFFLWQSRSRPAVAFFLYHPAPMRIINMLPKYPGYIRFSLGFCSGETHPVSHLRINPSIHPLWVKKELFKKSFLTTRTSKTWFLVSCCCRPGHAAPSPCQALQAACAVLDCEGLARRPRGRLIRCVFDCLY